MSKLKPREIRFIKFYLETSNGALSAKLAGYNSKTPVGLAVQAHKLLNRERIKKAMAEIMSPEEIQTELSEVGRISSSNIPALPSKLKALEMLGKVHGLWSDKLSISLERGQIEAAVEAHLARLGAGQADPGPGPEVDSQVVDSQQVTPRTSDN